MSVVNWFNLAKAADDPQTIGEAIVAEIATHDADATAHIGPGESLEAHRESEVADHLAESIVNDKIQTQARSYVAVVGSGAAGDFSTIQSAIAYAAGVGGGTIFIVPGTYYLAGAVALPMNINLYSPDREAVIVHGTVTGGDYLKPMPDTETGQTQQIIENINFVNDGGGFYYSPDVDLDGSQEVIFRNCKFTGGGTYVKTILQQTTLERCSIEVGGAAAFLTEIVFTSSFSTFTRYATSTTMIVRDTNPDNSEVCQVLLYNSSIIGGGVTNGRYFPSETLEEIQINDSVIKVWDLSTMDAGPGQLIGNIISMKSGQQFTFSTLPISSRWIGNNFQDGATPNVVLAGDSMMFIGNTMLGQVEDTGTGNFISGNAPQLMFKTAANADTAMIFGLRDTVRLTPNSTRTLTSTVPPAGRQVVLIILTSGTSSYTLTFGTGFKSTGTLATGTTTARRFVVCFISDGTFLIESSRTAAIA